MSKVKQYFYNIAVALDQLANASTGGDADTCVSSRLALNYPDSWARKFVDWFFYSVFGQEDHCYKSLRGEMTEPFNNEEVVR